MYFGDFEEVFGDVNNIIYLFDVFDFGFDGFGVVGMGRVEDVFDFVVLSLCLFGVYWVIVFDDVGLDGDEVEGDDCFFVYYVVFIVDGVGVEISGVVEDGRFVDEVVVG